MRAIVSMLFLLALCGCSGLEHVSAAEFTKEYNWVDKPQTMRKVAYLGRRDGKAFLRVSSMSTVNRKWSDHVIYVELKELEPAFRDALPKTELKE